MTTFDFIRPLTAEEYEALKADIKANGQLIPILRDQYNVTLDGHHRAKALTELGVPPDQWKVLQRTFADDDARIAAVLSANHHRRQSTPEDRKQLAIHLYKQNWTQERIAKQLGVSQSTIRDDLRGLVVSTKPSRPKGGRPKKGAPSAKQTATTAALAAAVIAATGKRPGHKYDATIEKAAAAAVLDEGKSTQEVKDELGVSEQVIIRATEYEKGRRAAAIDPEIKVEELALGAQEKLAAAIRQRAKVLEGEFSERVRVEVLKRTADRLKYFEMKEREYNAVVKARKGVFTRAAFKLILSCLHTDSRHSLSDAKMNAAFVEFQKHELVLVGEKDNPIPEMSFEDFMARRADTMAAKSKKKKPATPMP